MPILDPGDRQIAYTLQGPVAAPVLVLSNSLGTTMSMWDGQAAALAHDYRVLRYDTRGHGGSGAGPDPAAGYTLAGLGGDVLRLLDGLAIGRAHFCGISMGGLTGLWLGVHAGDRLHKLVVANSAARIGATQVWRERAALVRSSGMDQVADGAAARWFTPGYATGAPQVVGELIEDLRRIPPAGYAACCMALAAADLSDEIAAIATPTLLMAGARDPVTTVADADFMRGRIAGAAMVTLPASHLSNIEAEGDFTGGLRAFLGR